MDYNVLGKNFELGGEITTEEILKDIIDTDQVSEAKKEMVEGVNYYNTLNDILERDFRTFWVGSVQHTDYNKSNDCIVNGLHKKLVDQKVGYIASKPMTFKSDIKGLVDLITDVLGEKWNDTLQEWIQGASNKGRDELQPFIDEDGIFDYCLIPGEQVIYIYDTSYQKKVEQVVRYYAMEWVKDGEVIETIRVELWDDEKVTKYQEVEVKNGSNYYEMIQPGTMGVYMNPQYHWYTYNTNYVDKSQVNDFNDVDLVGVEAQSWEKVPFVSLKNNTESRTDLVPIKRYIDALDIVSSGFLNDLKDIQMAIWVLRGYEGTDLGEFMLNLQKFKAIKLSSDEGTSAEPKTLEIPKEARAVMLEWLEGKIYEVGMGVNLANIQGGSITNVYIKALFEDLNIKSNQLITKLKTALSEFMYFVVKYINDRDKTTYDYKDVTFVFDKSMISNEKEKVEWLVTLKGILSHKTILTNLPLDFDVDEELAQIKKEGEAMLKAMGGDMGFEDNNEPS